MKRLYPALIACLTASSLGAQTDSVTLGPGYQNEVWYSLSAGEQASNDREDWDLAFDVSPTGYSIRINAGSGTQAWAFPGDTGQFLTLDTTGMSSWVELNNGEESWYQGALNALESGLDVGWGEYNTSTHIITGNRIFVLKLSNGQFQKLIIESLTSGVFYIRHASLDNSMDMQHEVDKSQFSGKNFGYFSLRNHSAQDPEPDQNLWDLYFGRYTADLGIPYTVTGVLLNDGVEAARAYPVINPSTYNQWGNWMMSDLMNTIGYDWKAFDMNSGGYVMADSTVYFVKDVQGDIYKLVFTGFEGSSTGKVHFDRSEVSAISIDEDQAFFTRVYPNPATDLLNVVIDARSEVTVRITNMNGQTVFTEIRPANGLSAHALSISGFEPGLYVISFESAEGYTSERISIQ